MDLQKWMEQYPASAAYFPSHEVIGKECISLASSVIEEWEMLNRIVVMFEKTIRKRWLKFSIAQRKEVLAQAAEPTIPSQHRADNEYLFAIPMIGGNLQCQPEQLAFMKNSLGFMVPHINQEDLISPSMLLIFLNTRGRNHPKMFAHTELVHCPRSRWPDDLLWNAMDDLVIIFHGPANIGGYGYFMRTKIQGHARNMVNNGDCMHPGHGLQVLRIQLYILRFLKGCCKAILPEMDLDKLTREKYLEVPEPADILDDNIEFALARTIGLQAAYKLPAQIDYARLRTLVSGRVQHLEDHLWLLREDPSYFSEVYKDYSTHRIEQVSGYNSRKHPLKDLPEAISKCVVRDVVFDGYLELFHWHECYRQITLLERMIEKMTEKFSTDMKVDAYLLEKYMDALKSLWILVYAIMQRVHQSLKTGTVASPPLRKYWKPSPNSGFKSDWDKFEPRLAEFEGDRAVYRFFRFISPIWTESEPPLTGFGTDLDELDRFMDKEPIAKPLLTSYVTQLLAPLSIASTIIHQIRFYPRLEIRVQKDFHGLMSKHLPFTKRFAYMMERRSFDNSKLARLADPSDGKFDYPLSDQCNPTALKKACTAEANLDIFWTAADDYCRKTLGKALPELLEKDITHGRTIRRTPIWDVQEKTPKAAKEKKEPVTAPEEYTHQPWLLSKHDQSSEITGAFNKLSITKQEKPKTRGPANTEPTAITPPATANEGTDKEVQQTVFYLNKREFKVFRALFHTPLSRDIPGEVPWIDFLRAMVSTGFTAEKLHGSAWSFTPTKLDYDNPIQFHEPHPESKLPLVKARRCGRRLFINYGWKGEMFMLKSA